MENPIQYNNEHLANNGGKFSILFGKVIPFLDKMNAICVNLSSFWGMCGAVGGRGMAEKIGDLEEFGAKLRAG